MFILDKDSWRVEIDWNRWIKKWKKKKTSQCGHRPLHLKTRWLTQLLIHWWHSVLILFGLPEVIHSDQGRNFESDLFKELCQLLGIEKTRTTPYYPQSDGMVEGLNRTCQQMLKTFINENRDDWDDHLPYLMKAYLSSPWVNWVVSQHDDVRKGSNTASWPHGWHTTTPWVQGGICGVAAQNNHPGTWIRQKTTWGSGKASEELLWC